MILIGQYDSPFVRRVGIALTLYGFEFEHRAWSGFGDAERLRALNPLVRVPTLVLDDGEVLTDSHMMLDYLDSLVPAERAMFPRNEPARHRMLRATALATGLGEKAVSLFHETRLHMQVSDVWVDRCNSQIIGALTALEADRAANGGPFWFGDRISHADIALTCVLRFLRDVHGPLFVPATYQALTMHAARFEEMPVFQAISQPFQPPA